MFKNKPFFEPDRDIPDLTDQIIIVTGGNAGLGLETIRQLARHNPARIYLAARSRPRAEAAIEELTAASLKPCPILFLELDLSSFASVKNAAATFREKEERLDILINNAGIMMVPEGLTKEGYEIQFGTNVMGPVLFTQLLLPVLKDTAKRNPEARIVNLSSASQRMAPSDIYPWPELKTTMSKRNTTARYCISKIANIHYTRALSERVSDIKCISVHPGMVATNLHNESTGFFLRPFLHIAVSLFATPVEKGALSQIWAAEQINAANAANNRELSERLWQWIQEELKGHLPAELAFDGEASHTRAGFESA